VRKPHTLFLIATPHRRFQLRDLHGGVVPQHAQYLTHEVLVIHSDVAQLFTVQSWNRFDGLHDFILGRGLKV
jgi:hypothetical protein